MVGAGDLITGDEFAAWVDDQGVVRRQAEGGCGQPDARAGIIQLAASRGGNGIRLQKSVGKGQALFGRAANVTTAPGVEGGFDLQIAAGGMGAKVAHVFGQARPGRRGGHADAIGKVSGVESGHRLTNNTRRPTT